jgi:enterochelin esterase-like enzyme
MSSKALSLKRVIGVLASAALLSGIFGAPSATAAAPPGAPVPQAAALLSTAAAADPTITSDGFVTFSLTAPSATTVTVSGSWGLSYTNVAYPLSKSNGVWTAFLGPLTPGLYSYNFVVDGVATKDPGNQTVVHSNPSLSTFFVPGKGANFEAVQTGPKGKLATLTYHSAVTGTDRNAEIWTPPGYSAANRKTYPAFYLVHGGGGDYLDWVQQGRANVILDNLYNAHKIKPMVVVMVDGNIPGSIGLPESDSFVPEVLNNLLPAVQKHYNVSHSASQRALAGLSLGGLQAFNMLLSRPGAFAYVGDFSSGYFPAVIDQLKATDRALLTNKAINRSTKLFRIYIGNKADIAYGNNFATRALFDEYHIKYQFAGVYPIAGHVWKTWQHDLADFAPRLFR